MDKKAHGHEPHLPDPGQAQPEPKAERNFTDPASYIMPDGANKGGFEQGYNVQAAVDASAQVIVAAEVTQETTDHRQLLPMLHQVEKNLGRKPQVASADAGYRSEAKATDERVAGDRLAYHYRTRQTRADSGDGKQAAARSSSHGQSTSYPSRRATPSTKCGRRLSSRFLDRSKSSAASGASACAA